MRPYRGFKARKGDLSRKQDVRRGDIMRTIPPGSRRLKGQQIERLYVAALSAHPELLKLRADAQASVVACARHLARCADYETGTTRPTRARVCAHAKRSESTWKAARRRLEAWGFLGTVRPGCKYWHGEESRSDAAVYVICVPRANAFSPPPPSPSALTRPPTRLRSRRAFPPAPAREAKGPICPPSGRTRRLARRQAAGAAARALRQGPGQDLTDGWVQHLARPFLSAGWTAGDLQFAIDHDPGGRQHPYPVASVKHPAAWIRHRLRQWIQPPDHQLAWVKARPLESASQQRTAAAARARARAGQLRAEHAAAAAARADGPPPAAIEIFRQMGWRP